MSYVNTRDLIGDQNTLDKLVENTLDELYEDGVNVIANYALYRNSGLKYIEMPNLSHVGSGAQAFYNCTNLLNASLPIMPRILSSMFQYCTKLTSIYAPVVSMCYGYAFQNCYSLQSVYFPNLYSMQVGVFNSCRSLSSVVLSSGITHLPQNAFAACHELKSFNYPSVSSIQAGAFSGCEKISYINAPLLKIVSTSVFLSCMQLSSISIPEATAIYSSAFNNCAALMTISLPSVKSIYSNAFRNTFIDRLTLPLVDHISSGITNTAAEIDFGTTVNIDSLYGDYNLSALILRGQSICNLTTANNLANTAITANSGYIYVPDALVDTYKSATNWTAYANWIVSLDEYPKAIPTTDTISDSWSDIFAAEENGTYITKYSIGDTKTVDIGKFRVKMQIVAMDTDELADNSGNAKITWISAGAPFLSSLQILARNSGGWGDCPIRGGLMTQIYNNMDGIVKSGVKMVKKTFFDLGRNSTYLAEDYIWIPSAREVWIDGYESSGCDYKTFFNVSSKRSKHGGCQETGPVVQWWLRSHTRNSNGQFCLVNTNGNIGSNNGVTIYNIVFGFCT